MVTMLEAEDNMENNRSQVFGPVVGNPGDFERRGGCGGDYNMDQCMSCMCPMGKPSGEDPLSAPKQSLCPGCLSQNTRYG